MCRNALDRAHRAGPEQARNRSKMTQDRQTQEEQ